jgi:serine/threonine-protein kinase
MEPDPMIGTVLHDRYRILARLGEGGMGEVYTAEHIHINERFAVKLLRQEIVSNKEAVARFKQEAYSASSIKHPNIIRISDFGYLDDGRIYLCMELLDGEPLNEMIEEALDPARILDILIKTGHGLAAAHADGIVHRDMKPENVFVTHGRQGVDIPKILDFGIAKVSGNDGQNNLTRTGTIFGTPFYMAPEQALGQGVDHRADIYAMGVILYECFAGSVPFQGESFMGILTKHITAEPEPVAQRASAAGRFVPPQVSDIITRAMKKEPEERFSSMDEMVEAMVAARRAVAGAGMSAYMEAHVPGPPSSAMPAQGYAGQPHPTPMPHGQPMPPGPGGPQMPMHQNPSAGHSVPHAMHSGVQSAQYAAADSSVFDMPQKKGKGGLIAAIILVLAVAGGITAFVVLSGGENKDEVASNSGGDDGDDGDQGGDDNGAGDDGDQGGDDTGDQAGDGSGDQAGDGTGATTNNAGDGTGDQAGDGTGDQAGDGTGDQAGDGTGDQAGDGTGTDPVPEVKPIQVLVDGPDGAVVFRDGKRLEKVPTLIDVMPDEKVKLVLKRRGFHNKKVTLDGSKAKVKVRMKRKVKKPPKPDPAADLE